VVKETKPPNEPLTQEEEHTLEHNCVRFRDPQPCSLCGKLSPHLDMRWDVAFCGVVFSVKNPPLWWAL